MTQSNARLKYLLLALLVIIILAAIGYALARQNNQDATSNRTATPTPTSDSTSSSTPAAAQASSTPSPAATASPTQAGSYVDYTANSIAATRGTKILFFHAPWCPQCRALEASIKADTIPANTTIMKVDYDTNQALRKTYGVTLQTTLVRVDDAGVLVKKFVAYDEPSLAAVIENLL